MRENDEAIQRAERCGRHGGVIAIVARRRRGSGSPPFVRGANFSRPQNIHRLFPRRANGRYSREILMATRSTRGGLCVLTVAFLLLPSPAYAEPTSEDRAAAQSLFDEARNLVKAGRASEACPKLEESQRLDPGIGTQLNLADCYEKAGRTASAWALFLDAGEAARKTGDAKRESLATGNAKRLEPSLARVKIVVTGEIEGIVVKRDGRPLSRGALASALPTDPGKRVFEATAPGRRPVRVEIEVMPGRQTDVVIPALEKTSEAVVPPPASTSPAAVPSGGAATAPAPASREDKGPSGTQIGGLAAASVGVAALIGGTFLGLAAKSKNDDAKTSGCRPDGTSCTADALAQHDSAKSEASLATVAFIAGGVLVVGGAALFVLGSPRSKESASLYLVPSASGSSGGLMAGGTF